MRIRKAKVGNDSFGNVWGSDGAVVDVPEEQAWALLAIPDGGFSDAGPPARVPEPGEAAKGGSADVPATPARARPRATGK